MMRIFIDANSIYAINDIDDALHIKAVEIATILQQYSPTLYVSTHVISETITLLSQRIGKVTGVRILDELRSDKYVVIHPTVDTIIHAETIFRSIMSKNISYADCISFALMKEMDLDWTFSFDMHFKKQGFRRIGLDGFPKKIY